MTKGVLFEHIKLHSFFRAQTVAVLGERVMVRGLYCYPPNSKRWTISWIGPMVLFDPLQWKRSEREFGLLPEEQEDPAPILTPNLHGAWQAASRAYYAHLEAENAQHEREAH